MNIILVGCGKVGRALARHLNEEGHSITAIDTDAEKARQIAESVDVMSVVGNGASIEVLREAGVETADVLIAVTGSDELNLLCCMFAKKAGHCRAIARVRNPMYSHELEYIKQQMDISTIINPELTCAREISRLLRFPAAGKIDTFADGRVRLIRVELDERVRELDGVALRDVRGRMECDILICAVERSGDVLIPDGNFVLKLGDTISFLATQEQATNFFAKLHLPTKPVNSALIIGGGTIGYYLAKNLLEHDIPVRIVEQSRARCDMLAADLPNAVVINADGTDQQFLATEGMDDTGAVVALTGLDEENVLLAMYASKHSRAKVVAKVNWLQFDDVLNGLDIGSIVYPKYMVCDFVVQYVRALKNKAGSDVKTMYRMLDDRVEALELRVSEECAATAAPLSQLKLRKNLLVCCITRGSEVILPRGSDRIQPGDSVIVVTLEHGLTGIEGILK